MRHDDLDRMLSGEQEIIPSSGFVGSVMSAVRREAATPRPNPFPWKLALPGLIVAVLMLASVFDPSIALFIWGSAAQPFPAVLTRVFAVILEAAKTVQAGWIALALVLSFASVKLAIRIVAWKT